MIKTSKYIIVIAGALVVAALAYFYFTGSRKSIDAFASQIRNVKTMAQLCTVELYSEVAVKDTVNEKVLFGIQKQCGNVSFDLEKMQIDDSGDTVRIVLGPEIVEVNESADYNSWEVIDTKGLSLLTSDKLTDEEENQVKSNIRKNSIKQLYQNGTIERARAEGVRNLMSLMEKVYRKPVKVTDPTPKGAHADEY